MSYQIKTIKAGNITVVKKYHCFKHQEPGTKRRIKENITPEAKQKLNISNAVDRLYYRLCANFTEDDIFITLKYNGAVNKTISCKQVKTDVQRFIRLMRAEYKKEGKELKYALSYGISEYNVRHVHLVVTGINQRIIMNCWKNTTAYAGRITFEYLWSNYNYRGLAEYMVNNGISAVKYASDVFHHFFICSRNMQKPTISIKTVENSSTFKNNSIKYEGYKIIKQKDGFDFFGFRYIEFIMQKIE